MCRLREGEDRLIPARAIPPSRSQVVSCRLDLHDAALLGELSETYRLPRSTLLSCIIHFYLQSERGALAVIDALMGS